MPRRLSDFGPNICGSTILSVGLLLLAAGAAQAGITNLSASLDPFQEVPPHNTPAYGDATATLNGTTFTITSGNYYSLLGGANAVALYDGAAGANGTFISTLTLTDPGTTSGTFSGTATLTNAQAADVLAGNGYLNIRDSVYPSGELRGQLEVTKTPEPASAVVWSALAGGMLLAAGRRARRAQSAASRLR